LDKWISKNWCDEYAEEFPIKKKKMQYAEELMESGMEPVMPAAKPTGCAMIYAHSYVKWQTYEQAFSPCEALLKGTLFPELFGVYPIPE
jgi:thiazole synthase ThiGH ThiG subunit